MKRKVIPAVAMAAAMARRTCDMRRIVARRWSSPRRHEEDRNHEEREGPFLFVHCHRHDLERNLDPFVPFVVKASDSRSL
jgi:hypothetical protein